jgi:hypothetical protein
MAAGLQCFDASGNLVVDFTTRLARIVGVLHVTGSNLATPDPKLAGGTPFYAFQPDFIWGFINMDVSRPIFSIDNNGISWVYSAGSGTHNQKITGYVFYGVW